jgi:hypothetical protein
MRRFTLATATIAIAFAAAPAFAQEGEIRANIGYTHEKKFPDFTPATDDIIFATLKHHERRTFEFEIDPTREVAFAASCGTGCSDIDMFVWGSEDPEKTLDYHMGTDAFPFVAFRSPVARLSVRIDMSGCEKPSCKIGLGFYQNAGQ